MKKVVFILLAYINIYAQQTINLQEVVISKNLSNKELLKKILKKAKLNYCYNDTVFLMGSHLATENKDTVNYFDGNAKVFFPNYNSLHNVLHKSVFYNITNSVKYYSKKIYNNWFPVERAQPYEECIPWYFAFYLTRSFEFAAIKNIPIFKKFSDYIIDYQIEGNGLITLNFKTKNISHEDPLEGTLIINASDYAILQIKFHNFDQYEYDSSPHFYKIKNFAIDISYSNNDGKYSLSTIKTEMHFSGYGNKEKVVKEYKSVSSFEKSNKPKVAHFIKLFPPYL